MELLNYLYRVSHLRLFHKDNKFNAQKKQRDRLEMNF